MLPHPHGFFSSNLDRRLRRPAPLWLETLEERLTPAMPAILGPAVVGEGQTFTLQLDSGGQNLDHWIIDWGDDSGVEILPGAALQATHVYSDGPGEWTIQVNAVEVSPLTLFWWDPAAGGNGHYYALTSSASTWTQAEAEALLHGGHLVSITSQAEQDFILSRFLGAGNERNIYWIGIHDQAVEGSYVWSSGEAVTFTNWQAPNEPNNFNGVEDFGVLNWHFGQGRPTGVLGSWNDAPLNGVNSALNGSEPYFGIMEFAAPPPGPVTTLITQVFVENLAPQANLQGPTLGLRGESLTFTLLATDPSSQDQQGVFQFALDWDGDGHADEVVTGASGLQVNHAFADSGTYLVGVTALDKDGAAGPQFQQTVVIAAAILDNGMLRVGGTAQDDEIEVVNYGRNGVAVWINGALVGVFSNPDGVVVHGYNGNDRISVAGFAGWVELHGDGGNDWLKAGRGDALLVGGEGADLLLGGPGNDVLDGGAGNDQLVGGAGQNYLLDDLGADHGPGKPKGKK